MSKPVGFHVRFNPELHAGVRDRAYGIGMSMNELICDVLTDYLKNDVYIIKLTVVEHDGWLEYQMEIPEGLRGLHGGDGLAD